MVPSAPTTTGTVSAFNIHSFPNSIGKSCYLSIVSCSFTMIFWSLGIAMSMIKQLFAILQIHTKLGSLCSITKSIWIGRSHNILRSSALNQEHVHTICHYILGATFCILVNAFSFLLYHVFFGIASLPDQGRR